MKVCKDGRIWGQNNKEAANHLGVLIGRKPLKGGVKGSKNPMYGKHRLGDKAPMYGKSHSIEARRKMSEVQIGAKNPSWKGGVSSNQGKIRHQIEFKLWREAVFARDNWTCQECGKQGGYLNAHHIKSFGDFPELRFAIDNGKTLCIKHHKLTENYAGRRKN